MKILFLEACSKSDALAADEPSTLNKKMSRHLQHKKCSLPKLKWTTLPLLPAVRRQREFKKRRTSLRRSRNTLPRESTIRGGKFWRRCRPFFEGKCCTA